MRCIKRYGLACVALTLLILYVNHQAQSALSNGQKNSENHRKRRSRDYNEPNISYDDDDLNGVGFDDEKLTINRVLDSRQCRMENCFNEAICRKHGFNVYIYPRKEEYGTLSNNYQKILSSIKRTPYYTENISEACIKILSLDSIDRDPLSKERYVKNFAGRLSQIPTWNNGENHLVFNLYSGTWPDYLEDLGFDLGHAMLAKASISYQKYRSGFDVSLPLWGETHPSKGKHYAESAVAKWPSFGAHLMSFKGKRYLNGIGSVTRNSLYHLHDGSRSVMLTTCRHGKDWEKLCPNRECIEKCAADNEEYDRWDYISLLKNSTFCLVPRGRRLGSFRFIETLQQACVPVLLADDWVLPFSEVIDWERSTISWEEKLLLELGQHLEDVSPADVLRMRQEGANLYSTYFSSVDQIVRTTLEIIRQRIFPEAAAPKYVWNSTPGTLSLLPNIRPSNTPFYIEKKEHTLDQKFTALIHTVQTVPSSAAPIIKLIKNLWKTDSCGKIIVLWACEHPPPVDSRWPPPPEGKHFVLLREEELKVSNRLFPYDQIEHDAVLSLDNDVSLHPEEIAFAFSTWLSFPERIVGFPSRRHYNRSTSKTTPWRYTSKWGNHYSIVLTGAAFIHKYYFHLFQSLPSTMLKKVNDYSNCEDILMNFMVSEVSGQPPVKVTQKKQYMTKTDSQEPQPQVGKLASRWENNAHFTERQQCMNFFVDEFGTVPLIETEVRFDPLLFRDDVARMRKKYPNVDTVET